MRNIFLILCFSSRLEKPLSHITVSFCLQSKKDSIFNKILVAGEIGYLWGRHLARASSLWHSHLRKDTNFPCNIFITMRTRLVFFNLVHHNLNKEVCFPKLQQFGHSVTLFIIIVVPNTNFHQFIVIQSVLFSFTITIILAIQSSGVWLSTTLVYPAPSA